MASHIFRIFKPDETKEDRVQRRRDQLRDAQKNYRDRKTRYTRSLEQELGRVRASEASLLREAGRLRSILQNLTLTMRHHGLDVPDGSDTGSPPGSLGYAGSPLGSAGYAGIDDVVGSVPSGPASDVGTHSDQLSPGFSALGSRGPRPSPPQHSHSHGHSPESSATTDVCLGGWDSGVEAASPGVRVCDVDPIGAGMDFVLTIERPCLGHLHGDLSKPDDPDGHALTASSHLLCVNSGRPQQQPPPPKTSQPSPGTVCQDVPSAVLESLLSLSSELAAEHEVTPIQAWNAIRCRPQFGGLELRSLSRLAKNLRDAVKCHGFGAVIDRRVFEKLVSQFLFDGRPF